MTRPNARTHVIAPKDFQSNETLSANKFVRLSQETTNVAFGRMGNTQSWSFDTGFAPYADLTTEETAVTFNSAQFPTADLEVPWLWQRQYNRLDAMIMYTATHQSNPYQFRLRTEDLSAAVTEVVGPWSEEDVPKAASFRHGEWRHQVDQYTGVVVCSLADPDLPADRLCSIEIDAQFLGDEPFTDNNTRRVRIVNLMFAEYHQVENV